MYRPRDVAPTLIRTLASMPVVVITGMRQVGKTTLLRRQAELTSRRYVTLDAFTELEAARRDPEALVAGDEPVTVDEAQRCPELLLAIKRLVDDRPRAGQFLLSGSANFALLRDVSESLAGRAAYLTLHPFSRRELKGITGPPFLRRFFDHCGTRPGADAPGVPKVRFIHGSSAAGLARVVVEGVVEPVAPEEILIGGMPGVAVDGKPPDDRRTWFEGFERTYLERDLRDLSVVQDLVAFRRVLHLAALRTAQILNEAELGRDARVKAMTTGRWLSLLETSFVLGRLPAFLGNRASRLVKAPKIMMADSGLAAYLSGVEDLGATTEEPMRGALLETYLAQNLASIVEAHWREARLHYWCVQGRYEVDFVIESGRDCLALELKAATRWSGADVEGLEEFLRRTPRCRAAVLVHNGTEAVRLQERLWALPLALVVA